MDEMQALRAVLQEAWIERRKSFARVRVDRLKPVPPYSRLLYEFCRGVSAPRPDGSKEHP